MSTRTYVVASLLAVSAAIAVAHSPHGTRGPEAQSQSNCVEIAHPPSADELAMRDAAARGMLDYSGIQLSDPAPEEIRGSERVAYGAF
jgi:hypothetical protein